MIKLFNFEIKQFDNDKETQNSITLTSSRYIKKFLDIKDNLTLLDVIAKPSIICGNSDLHKSH